MEKSRKHSRDETPAQPVQQAAQPPPEVYLPMKPVDFMVLMALLQQPRHGYGIVKDIEEQSRGQVKMMPGNLYAILRRLMKDGLLEESEQLPSSDEDQRRRYYRITDTGRGVAAAEARRLRHLVSSAESAELIGREEA